MRNTICLLALLIAFTSVQAQKTPQNSGRRLGFKGGYNWSYLTGSSQGFTPETKSGFMVGAFFAPASSSGRGFRSELVFSRQGYSFDEGGKNTDVLNDYIYLPQLATFNIGKFLQLQAGGQIGYLLKSVKMKEGISDSTITDFMNRLDYGFAAGIELNPVKGLLIGGRYNLGLGKLHEKYSARPSNYPLPFDPTTADFKNAVIQFFIGYRF